LQTEVNFFQFFTGQPHKASSQHRKSVQMYSGNLSILLVSRVCHY